MTNVQIVPITSVRSPSCSGQVNSWIVDLKTGQPLRDACIVHGMVAQLARQVVFQFVAACGAYAPQPVVALEGFGHPIPDQMLKSSFYSLHQGLEVQNVRTCADKKLASVGLFEAMLQDANVVFFAGLLEACNPRIVLRSVVPKDGVRPVELVRRLVAVEGGVDRVGHLCWLPGWYSG